MKKMKSSLWIAICLSGALLISSNLAFAEDVTPSEATPSEDSLFSGDDTVVSSDQVVNDTTGDELQQKHLGFSGEINAATAYTNYSSDYDWTGKGGPETDQLSNQIAADFFLDIRLQNGIKGFLSFEADYYPAISPQELGLSGTDPQSITNLAIKEFFVDSNWNNKVYFRTGKQVLQWGQCYFWNPTDLINVERKSFYDMDKVREGTFGEKIQIPSGVKQNTYFFVNMNDAKKLNDISLAGKYEFLVKNTEMSLSAWTKNGYTPVYGYDISGRVFDLDYRGEVSLSNGLTSPMLNYDTLAADSKDGEWIPRVSVGFTKSFDYGEVQDRINVTNEFYYNQAGYDKNIFQRLADNGDANLKATYLTDYYQAYQNSKYYWGLFSSVGKFIVPEMTLSCNSIMNLVDKSATVSAGISYVPALTDMEFDFTINGALGGENTEATFMGSRLSVNLGTRISF